MVASLCNSFGFSDDSVGAEDRSINFPGGYYNIEFHAGDQRSGILRESVTFEPDWFTKPEQIPKILKCFNMFPSEMHLHLTSPIRPKDLIAGLKAKGWTMKSLLTDRIIAELENYTVVIEPAQISF